MFQKKPPIGKGVLKIFSYFSSVLMFCSSISNNGVNIHSFLKLLTSSKDLCVFIISQRCLEWIYTLRLRQSQWSPCSKQMRYLKIKWLQQIQADNHLVCKWALNYLSTLASLGKWLSDHLWIRWLWVRVSLQSLCQQNI